ncbi:hypothetical protein GTW25_03690 [Aliihoeflea aestuarii]|uniref:hypothetical protein n=1 Tax=Aliihoeflea aestuarii TaxID=453840 RepID=UPI002091FE1B|nr:hypothetical protein [Aliihoeflea aestuarii]MCO6390127.1 hypothetical protein [Aliihoeflea aestuarii]
MSIFVLLVEIVIYLVVLWFVIRFVWPVIIMMPLAFALMILEMARLFVEDFRRLTSRAGAAEQ